MPQRNGQNPIRAARANGHDAAKFNDDPQLHNRPVQVAGVCASCGTPVPPKPGFRPSALKCPKCGTLLGKK